MASPGITIRYFLDGNSVLQQALSGGNGVATTTGATLFDVIGNPIQPGNPLQVQDVVTEAAVSNVAVGTASIAAGIGTQADPAWGLSGNASLVALGKATVTALTSPLSITAVEIKGTTGNIAIVNGDGSQLTSPEATYLSAPPTLTNGQKTPFLTDNLGNLLVNSSTSNGTAGTGIIAPTGGSGLLGFLSGIFQAVTGTLTAALAAGTNTIGTVLLGASSAVIGAVTQSGTWSVNQAGSWVLSAGSALIGMVTSKPTNAAGTYANVPVTTGTSLVPASTATAFIDIQNLSSSANLTLIAGGETIRILLPYGTYTREGAFIPTDAITGTSSSGTITAAVSYH